MAEETSDGIAYLLALRRSAGPAAAAPAREESPQASTNEQGPKPPSYQDADRRRSPRYQCQGSVQMREANGDVRTWALFTDISLHGCYVEAQATYPAGTVLQLQLETKGIRVDAKGTVRVNYPYLGMGIAFSEMSSENQVKLKELLGSLSPPSMIVVPGMTSTPTARGSLELPPITKSDAVVEALVEFFRDRQLLMRDDFARIVRQTQEGLGKS